MDRQRLHIAVKENYMQACLDLLEAKGGDYSGDKDVFASLKRNAELAGVPVHKIILIFMQKQYDALNTGIREGKVRSESLRSRLVDLANYCFLMLAWLDEEETQAIKVTVGPSNSVVHDPDQRRPFPPQEAK